MITERKDTLKSEQAKYAEMFLREYERYMAKVELAEQTEKTEYRLKTLFIEFALSEMENIPRGYASDCYYDRRIAHLDIWLVDEKDGMSARKEYRVYNLVNGEKIVGIGEDVQTARARFLEALKEVVTG